MATTVNILVDDPGAWPEGDDAILLEGFRDEQFGEPAPREVDVRLTWLERQRQEGADVGFLPQPYEQLAAVYDRMGHEEDARKVRIAKRKAERKRGNYRGCVGWRIGF
jgi:hypothetical protein